MTEPISNTDADFVARLHGLVEERRAALPAPPADEGHAGEDAMRRAQEGLRAQWDFDGSIVVGRADTVDGQRYYIGTRSVITPEDVVVVVAQDSALARAVWTDVNVQSPGRTALKRHLRVAGWSIDASGTEFDLRSQSSGQEQQTPAPPTPPPPAESPQDQGGRYGELYDDMSPADENEPAGQVADPAQPDVSQPVTDQEEPVSMDAAQPDTAPADVAPPDGQPEPVPLAPPSGPPVPAPGGGSDLLQDLAALESARTSAADALRTSLAAVESGRVTGTDVGAAAASWDGMLSQAGAALGLPPEELTFDRVQGEVMRIEEDRRARAEQLQALDQRISVLQDWIAGGGPGADETRALLAQMTALRDQVAAGQ